MRNDPQLSNDSRLAIANPSNQIFISAASIWEIRIKQSLNRLEGVPENLLSIIQKQPVKFLSITADHVDNIRFLPLYHKDPFDRILIVQSILENLTLVTKDKEIMKYKIAVLKA